MTLHQPLAPYLAEPTRIGEEISITGKWVPRQAGGRFRTSEDSREMLAEWESIHQGARAHAGMLSTEINHAVGEDAILVHHVFENAASLHDYFATTATEHMAALATVAKPDLHLVRGAHIADETQTAVRDKGVTAAFGEHLFGFVKHDHRLPDPATAINVTAKWTCKPSEVSKLDELTHCGSRSQRMPSPSRRAWSASRPTGPPARMR